VLIITQYRTLWAAVIYALYTMMCLFFYILSLVIATTLCRVLLNCSYSFLGGTLFIRTRSVS